MNEMPKQLSNPFSTGGGGTNYENHVHAYFVTLMLSHGSVPGLPPWPIVEINLQTKRFGYDIDDSRITVRSPDGKNTASLLCQIKHSISITKGSKEFGEVIRAAWNDFNKTVNFHKGCDAIALITGPLSETDNHVREILEWARHRNSAEEFFTDIRRAKFSSETKCEKLDVIRHHIEAANNGQKLENSLIWEFLKTFYIFVCDLDFKTGITLSLLETFLNLFSKAPNTLWTKIVNEVSHYNQAGGTITINRLPEEIREAFPRPIIQAIPEELTITGENWNFSKLSIGLLLGKWDENNKNDTQIIQQLAGENYSNWNIELRNIANHERSPFSIKNGVWKTNDRIKQWQNLGPYLFDEHLDRFGEIVIEVLKERDPQFEMEPEKRYLASLHGKVVKYSETLRKGLAETLALLGTHPDALKNCSRGKAKSVAVLSIRNIFKDSDWVLWGSLDSLLPTLAEAAPEEFLNAVEAALQKSPCPFDELFSQEGKGFGRGNYMTGLLWGLEALAWSADYLMCVTVILGKLALRDPGGNWANRPINSLISIFLPWVPRTAAPFEKRKRAVETLLKETPDAGWNLLLNLLPDVCRVSSETYKTKWRKFSPDDEEKKITNEEYGEQVRYYSHLAVETAKRDTAKLKNLISYLENLHQSSFEELLSHLESEKVRQLGDDDRTEIWEKLNRYLRRHKLYLSQKADSGSEILKRIEQIAENLRAENPEKRYRYLFVKQDISLYEEGDYEEQENKLKNLRQKAIQEILEKGGFEAVMHFLDNAEDASKVGYSLGMVSDDTIDGFILPDRIEDPNEKIKSFAYDYVRAKFRRRGWPWVNQLDLKKWSSEKIGAFLTCLPSKKETWAFVGSVLGENEIEYWKRAYIFPDNAEDSEYAAQKLIQYKRPHAALSCLWEGFLKTKKLNIETALRALMDAVSTEESFFPHDRYLLSEIIRALQEDPEVNPDELLKVEWAYLPLLAEPGKTGEPKILERKLASDPDFFCELIRMLYHSRKELEVKKEPTEQEKAVAENIMHLFWVWKRIPGTDSQNNFSPERFQEWLQKVKKQCEESGHLDVALETLGAVLIYSPPDPDGLWIHRTVAEALNAEDAESLRKRYYMGIMNSRGFHFVDPSGKPERELAVKYRKQAEDVENAGYYRFAQTLRDLAKTYENEAQRIIDEYNQEQNNQ